MPLVTMTWQPNQTLSPTVTGRSGLQRLPLLSTSECWSVSMMVQHHEVSPSAPKVMDLWQMMSDFGPKLKLDPVVKTPSSPTSTEQPAPRRHLPLMTHWPRMFSRVRSWRKSEHWQVLKPIRTSPVFKVGLSRVILPERFSTRVRCERRMGRWRAWRKGSNRRLYQRLRGSAKRNRRASSLFLRWRSFMRVSGFSLQKYAFFSIRCKYRFFYVFLQRKKRNENGYRI